MRLAGWSEISNYHCLQAELEGPANRSVFDVLSVHLGNNGPTERKRQFDMITSQLDPSRLTVICGDLNVVDQPFLKPFNWIMGSSVREGLPWFPERRNLEQEFKSRGLWNPLLGRRTHVSFSNQLDHILIPVEWKVSAAGVEINPQGSDHYAAWVETENADNASGGGHAVL